MTQRQENVSVPPRPRDAVERKRDEKRHLDQKLDEALKETFPASDPIAVTPPRQRKQ